MVSGFFWYTKSCRISIMNSRPQETLFLAASCSGQLQSAIGDMAADQARHTSSASSA